MSDGKGKQFEQRFKQDWLKTFPGSFIYRLPDQMSGLKVVSANPCDFLCFTDGKLFLIENKSHDGASLPFSAIRQYDKLVTYAGIPGVRAGVVCWLYSKDKVIYAPISTIKQMKEDGLKSLNPSKLEDKYKIYDIPSVKKRVFMESDYSILLTTQEGE